MSINTTITRELGETLAISIGTAIPLEALLTSDISKGYSALYLNVRTLHRNFHGAFPKGVLPNPKEYLQQFIDELMTIKSVIAESVHGKIHPVFYTTTGKSLGICLPHAKLKLNHTTIQQNYETLEKQTITKALTKVEPGLINVYDILIKGNNVAALIITHLPTDLLSYHSFRKLVLLESHTGALKTYTEWILKLTKNELYRNIPFNVLTLQILGDRNNQLESISNKMRKQLLDLATSNNWSAVTTMAKIQFDIRKLQDKALAAMLLEMTIVKLK